MNTMWLYRVLAAGMISLMLPCYSAVIASPLDHDDVVPLVQQGQIIPLVELLQRHQEKLDGRLIDLELEHEHGRLIYELQLIDSQGIVREFLIDAKTGEWLGEE